MSNANGYGAKTAILYARVSTEEQARHGYSIRQQLERGREWCAENGYEVLAEIVDAGQSGASLERPGMDEVRDRVAEGSVHLVWAQDRDRFSREPAYTYLLKREFEEYGTKMRSDNDRGDDSPEGELTDGILDQLAKFERAKTAERTRRGRLRKAREGKIIAGHTPNFGFAFNKTRDGYILDEEAMQVVRRIFRMVGDEGRSIYYVVRRLNFEGVPAPKGDLWNKTMVRNIILSDLYCPHAYNEIIELVSPDVATRLDPQAYHGVWWFNRRRVIAKQVPEEGPEGIRYRRRNKSTMKGREEWVAVPVPDAGISRHTVDTTRRSVANNYAPSNAGRRFWQLSGKMIRCAECGSVMEPHTVGRKNGKQHFYYQCRRRYNNAPRDCVNRKSVRAEEVETLVWEFVSGLLKDPARLRKGVEAVVEAERIGLRTDPDREIETWKKKLTELETRRSNFQDMAAGGLLTFDELRVKLAALQETRKMVQYEIEILTRRRKKIEQVEKDSEALMRSYAGVMPEALEMLSTEERHRIYKMLKLQVLTGVEGGIKVTGMLENGSNVCALETAS